MPRIKKERSERFMKDLQYVRNYVQHMSKFGEAYMTKQMLNKLKDPLFNRLFKAYVSLYKANQNMDAIALEYSLSEELN